MKRFWQYFLSFFPTVRKKRETWDRVTELLMSISEMQGQLKENATVFRAIFCINPCAMIIVDAESAEIKDINETFEELSGYERNDIIGKTVFDVGLYMNTQDRYRVVSKIIEQGYVRHEPLNFISKAGDVKNCLMSTKMITMQGKRIMLSVILDQTELIDVRAKYNRLNQERRDRRVEDKKELTL